MWRKVFGLVLMGIPIVNVVFVLITAPVLLWQVFLAFLFVAAGASVVFVTLLGFLMGWKLVFSR